MAYDTGLAERIREVLSLQEYSFDEKNMFGGIAFLLHGNMVCGITSADFVVRVGKDNYQDALSKPATRPMDFTGKPLTGWVYVNSVGVSEDNDLQYWVQQGVNYARQLPPK